MRSAMPSATVERLKMLDLPTILSISILKGISNLDYLIMMTDNRFGYIDFKIEEATKSALKMNGKEVKGRKILVVMYKAYVVITCIRTLSLVKQREVISIK